MLSGILNKLSQLFAVGEHVIFPPETKEKPPKLVKIEIVTLNSKEELPSLRAKISEAPLVLINIANVRGDLKHIVEKLKLMAKQFDHKIYGLDTKWLLSTKLEIEKKG